MIGPAIALALLAGVGRQPDPGTEVLKLLAFGWCTEGRSRIAGAPPEVAKRVDEFASRCDLFRKENAKPRSDSGEGMAAAARWGYEGRLFAVTNGGGADASARDYVETLRPCYEWEGYSDCPEREAVFADRYLARHPDGPFAAYLPLLGAHRWFCVAEAYEYEAKNHVRHGPGAVGLQEARRRWKADLAKALRSPDPLVRFGAEALQQTGRCF